MDSLPQQSALGRTPELEVSNLRAWRRTSGQTAMPQGPASDARGTRGSALSDRLHEWRAQVRNTTTSQRHYVCVLP
jgi:hypothetical protein